MNWCKSCLLPDTRPGIVLSDSGSCNACSNYKKKELEINWLEREEQFQKIVKNNILRTSSFDCVIPVSGGKDSTWQVVKCLEYGLRPLAVTWKTPARTKIGQKNLDNLVNLGVDHIDWQVNPNAEKVFMLKSLERFGSTAIPMHMALFNIPLKIAVKFNIPLVIWGENSAFEYGSGGRDSLMGHRLDSSWLKQFGVTHGTTAGDWIDQDLTEKDLSSYFGPSDIELENNSLHAIFLGHYFKWDVETSLRSAVANGFEADDKARTGIYNYADIDDDFISIHHWLKWYKFGITRSFDNLSLEIRAGRISRSDALKQLLEKGEERPDADIQKLCNYLNISEDTFLKIAEKFRNTKIWKKSEGTWKIENFILDNWKW
jgi:N-acetyl sugar amidotransferase